MGRYRVVDKVKFSIFLITVFSIMVLGMFFIINSLRVEGDILVQEYHTHFTKEGDTIWNIALQYKPKKYDVRKMVYDIKEFNGMESSYIYPGEQIKIPVHK